MRKFKGLILIAIITFVAFILINMPVIAENDTTPPKVVKTTPANGATNVDVNTRVIITFSETIDPGGKGGLVVTDEAGNEIEAGIIDYEDNIAEICINYYIELMPNKKYIVNIGPGLFEDLSLNENEPYTFSFSTGSEDSAKPADTIPVTVVKTEPKNGETGVSRDSIINIYFSEPIGINYDLAPDNPVTLEDDKGKVLEHTKTDIPLNNGMPNILRIFPVQGELKPDTTYVIKIAKGAFKGFTGNINDEYTFKFTTKPSDASMPTVVSTYPADEAEGVALDSQIYVDFSEEIDFAVDVMDAFASIDVGDIYGNSIREASMDPPQHSATKRRIVITPGKGTLKPNTKYYVKIPKDIFKNKLGKTNDTYAFSFTTTSSKFSDVSTIHWANAAINEMSDRGVISGYPDGTFKPNNKVTREQFAKMMVLALDLKLLEPNKASFNDLSKGTWSYSYVETAKPYLTGYKQGNNSYFKGGESAIREDIAVALVKALKLENQDIDVSELDRTFKDANEVSPELKKYVLIAYKNKLISGYGDGTFKAQGKLTRAEAASLLLKVIQSDVMK